MLVFAHNQDALLVQECLKQSNNLFGLDKLKEAIKEPWVDVRKMVVWWNLKLNSVIFKDAFFFKIFAR